MKFVLGSNDKIHYSLNFASEEDEMISYFSYWNKLAEVCNIYLKLQAAFSAFLVFHWFEDSWLHILDFFYIKQPA